MRWRRLYTALAFAVIGPAVAVVLILILFAPGIGNLGPFASDAFWNLLAFVYLVGAPPLALAGLLVAVSAQRGARLPTLTLLSAAYGALFSAVSGLMWTFLVSGDTQPGWDTVMAIAVGGAIAGFVSALVIGVWSLMRRRAA